MKRGGQLARRTPLRAKTALVGSSPLARSSRLTRQAMARKRPQRSPEEAHARAVVRARSAGICEVCGAAPAANFQHRKGRGQLGAWTAANGLDVCGHGNATGCHGLIHQRPTLAYANGWSVRSGHDPARVPVLLHGHAWALPTDSGWLPASPPDTDNATTEDAA